VLRKVFGPKRKEGRKEGRKGQDAGEDCTVRAFITCTLDEIFIIWVIKSRRMRWAEHVARTVEVRST